MPKARVGFHRPKTARPESEYVRFAREYDSGTESVREVAERLGVPETAVTAAIQAYSERRKRRVYGSPTLAKYER